MSDPFRTSQRDYVINPPRTWDDRLESIAKFLVPSLGIAALVMFGSWAHGCVTKKNECTSKAVAMASTLKNEKERLVTNEIVTCASGATLSLKKESESKTIFAVCQCDTLQSKSLTTASANSSSFQEIDSSDIENK